MSAPVNLPRWADVALVPAVSVVAAFLVAGLVVLFIGEDPLTVTRVLIYGSLGTGYSLGFTLFYATNFIFTGLAVAVAFHALFLYLVPPVQHRRRGAGDPRRHRARAGAPVPAGPRLPGDPARRPRRGRLRRLVGRGAGLPPGLSRQPYRHHDDHVQLARLDPLRLPPRQRAAPAHRDEPGDAALPRGLVHPDLPPDGRRDRHRAAALAAERLAPPSRSSPHGSCGC